MKIAVVGGIWTLAQNYGREVEKSGHRCVHFNGYTNNLRVGLARADAIVLFTNTVSHQAAGIVRMMAREAGIPLLCATGSGVSALRRCLTELAQTTRAAA